ncbi:hypothetical protein EMPS_05269 [Entomortierella parvispora]|uniref:Mechanosensitive ion channel MscS domain-containing protein n=1 Tax=Entomortierella parvispora TaxID=205924 RepID=A0A9P3LW68_9FUNG|nr:hypothetical protein EMPS_05269 [Entomortierella parvispora]
MDTNSTDPSSSPSGVPSGQPMATVTAAFVILGVTAGAILLHLVLTLIFKRIAKKTIWQFDDDLVKYCKKPTFIMFPVVALLITIQLVTLPLGVYGTLNHALIIVLLFTISYLLVMLIKCGSLAVGRNNSHLKDSAPKRAREVETQIVVMTRIVQGMVWLLGLSGIAMTFPNAWQVGVSLLASASVSALLLGFAAKPSIENALASLTIALTQPFILEDQVTVNGEVGHIEEIQSQYVIVRTLDERRLVVPLTWFLANIFQNWSRNSSQQIGECKLYVDYTMPVPRIRQYFLKFARSHPLYDGRHCALLVTDCSVNTITLTCQVSVANAMDVMQVTSDIREAMVEYIAKKVTASATTSEASSPPDTIKSNLPPPAKITPATTPPADSTNPTLSLLGLDWREHKKRHHPEASHTHPGGTPPSPPLPPLSQEDEKMGEGSRMYLNCPSINGKDAASKNPTNSVCEKSIDPSETSTAVSSTGSRDHVRVDVDGSGQDMTISGLTRRGARDTAPGEAVVPTIVTEK